MKMLGMICALALVALIVTYARYRVRHADTSTYQRPTFKRLRVRLGILPIEVGLPMARRREAEPKNNPTVSEARPHHAEQPTHKEPVDRVVRRFPNEAQKRRTG